MKNLYLALGLALVPLLGLGCNMNEFSVNLTAPVLHEASKAFAMENDLQFAREAAPGNLVTLVGFLYSAPNNRYLLETCAQGFAEYAFGFLEDDLEQLPDDDKHEAQRKLLTQRATDLYDRALGFSLRLIATDDKHFDAAFKKDVTATEAEAKKLDKDSVAGLMFGGMSLASAINLNRNDVARVVDLPKAIAMIKRAHELDPKFDNASAAMLLGVVYSSQGKAMGGNPELAKKFFDEAIAATGGKYLLVKVMMARFYAVVIQDRALFDKTMKDVLAAPSDIWPEQRLANELAKRRAKRYLDHAEDYF
jgi:tetratricopeptide (TPR) repeat protein